MNDYEYHLVEEVRAGRISRRELIRRASIAGFSASSLPLLISACGGSDSGSSGSPASRASEGAPKAGGTVTMGSPAATADIDAVASFGIGRSYTLDPSLECLCYPRADYTLEPKIATSWSAGKTTKEWTFKIRQGVTFHDGSPLTVDDVIASFDVHSDPKGTATALSAFQGILEAGNIEKVDEETIRFHLERPYSEFPYLTSNFTSPYILPKGYEVGSFKKGGIGTGPFVLKTYTQDRQATYEKNPNYWNPKLPYLDGMTIKYFADVASQVLAMQAGDIDIYLLVPYQGGQALFANPKLNMLEAESSEYREMHMRVDMDPWKDQRVRQAVAYSLDREGLLKGLFDGAGSLGNDHPFAPIFPASSLAIAEVPQREQDYEQAKQLLADAGHPGGFSTTLTTEQYQEIPQYVQLVKAQCEPAGIKIDLDVQSQAKYYGSGDNQPWLDVPFGVVDWGERGSPSQLITPAYTKGAVWNSAKWSDPTYDKLMLEFDGESDEQRRKQIAVELAKIQHEATPAVIAYWITQQRATTQDIHGLAGGPAAHLDPSGIWRG